jgi:hypothetical protein
MIGGKRMQPLWAFSPFSAIGGRVHGEGAWSAVNGCNHTGPVVVRGRGRGRGKGRGGVRVGVWVRRSTLLCLLRTARCGSSVHSVRWAT